MVKENLRFVRDASLLFLVSVKLVSSWLTYYVSKFWSNILSGSREALNTEHT